MIDEELNYEMMVDIGIKIKQDTIELWRHIENDIYGYKNATPAGIASQIVNEKYDGGLNKLNDSAKRLYERLTLLGNTLASEIPEIYKNAENELAKDISDLATATPLESTGVLGDWPGQGSSFN